jgi:hypothetical protein
MSHLLRRWTVLLPAMFVSWALLLWYGFNRVDLRFEAFAALLVVPLAQAAVLSWATRGWSWTTPPLWREISALPFAATSLVVDLAIVAAGVVASQHPMMGIAARGSVQVAWAGTKAIVAGLLLAYGLGGPHRGSRWLIVALAIEAIALGTSAFTGWLVALPSTVHVLVRRLPITFQVLIPHAALWSLVVLTILALVSRTRATIASVARLLDLAVAALVVVGVAVLLTGFNYGSLQEPARSIALLAASVAASCVLLAAQRLAVRAA